MIVKGCSLLKLPNNKTLTLCLEKDLCSLTKLKAKMASSMLAKCTLRVGSLPKSRTYRRSNTKKQNENSLNSKRLWRESIPVMLKGRMLNPKKIRSKFRMKNKVNSPPNEKEPLAILKMVNRMMKANKMS